MKPRALMDLGPVGVRSQALLQSLPAVPPGGPPAPISGPIRIKNFITELRGALAGAPGLPRGILKGVVQAFKGQSGNWHITRMVTC